LVLAGSIETFEIICREVGMKENILDWAVDLVVGL